MGKEKRNLVVTVFGNVCSCSLKKAHLKVGFFGQKRRKKSAIPSPSSISVAATETKSKHNTLFAQYSIKRTEIHAKKSAIIHWKTQ